MSAVNCEEDVFYGYDGCVGWKNCRFMAKELYCIIIGSAFIDAQNPNHRSLLPRG